MISSGPASASSTTEYRGLRGGEMVLLALGTSIIIALYLAHAIALDYLVDDAYISFQYARNLARGNGLVYNVGEYVEGYTNFLWVIHLGLMHMVLPAADMLAVARATALLCGVTTLIVLVLISVQLFPGRPWLHLVAPFALACNSSFCAWSTGGLETTAFTLLVLLSYWGHGREFTRGGSTTFALAPAILACFMRADGFVFFGILTLARVHEHWCSGKPLVGRRMALWLGTFALMMVPYVLWRVWYYGEPMPNTFYAKVGGSVDQWIRGARYVKSFLEKYGGMLLIPMMLLGWVHSCGAVWSRSAWWLIALWTAYIIKVGGDGLAYFRFVCVILPIVYLMAQAGLAGVARAFATENAATKAWAPSMALLAIGVMLGLVGAGQSNHPLRHPDEGYAPYRQFDAYFVARQEAAGLWLKENSPPDALVASTPAGSIAFYSERPVLDMLGLTDRHIARVKVKGLGKGRAGHEKGDGAYVLRRKPQFILMGNVAVGREPLDAAGIEAVLCQRSEHELWRLPQFHEEYELRSVRLAESGPFQYFTFYQRRAIAP